MPRCSGKGSGKKKKGTFLFNVGDGGLTFCRQPERPTVDHGEHSRMARGKGGGRQGGPATISPIKEDQLITAKKTSSGEVPGAYPTPLFNRRELGQLGILSPSRGTITGGMGLPPRIAERGEIERETDRQL